jgi:hypothetical protein
MRARLRLLAAVAALACGAATVTIVALFAHATLS